MPDSVGIEIIRRLIEQEYIWLLYESSSKEESCLLTSREARYDTLCEICELDLLRWCEVHGIEYFEDISIDIVCIAARVLPEICSERELLIIYMHHLACDTDMLSGSHEDTSLFWLIFSGDHLEYGGFPSTILPHEGDLRSLSY